MDAKKIARTIVDGKLYKEVQVEIRKYELRLATAMILSDCIENDLRKRFGATRGQVLWHMVHGTKHPHKNYKQ